MVFFSFSSGSLHFSEKYSVDITIIFTLFKSEDVLFIQFLSSKLAGSDYETYAFLGFGCYERRIQKLQD